METAVRKGRTCRKRVPYTAPETMAEGEFNRYDIRGLCRSVIGMGGRTVLVYRARSSRVPRPESDALIGRLIDAEALLEDMRNHPGIDTAFGRGLTQVSASAIPSENADVRPASSSPPRVLCGGHGEWTSGAGYRGEAAEGTRTLDLLHGNHHGRRSMPWNPRHRADLRRVASRCLIEGPLIEEFERIRRFCLEDKHVNCFLIEKDLPAEGYGHVQELVDLRRFTSSSPGSPCMTARGRSTRPTCST